MFGKIIGAVVGNKAAKHVRGISGTGGTLLGVAAPTILRRMGPLGLVATVAGGYAWKKYSDRRQSERTKSTEPSVLATPAVTSP